MFDRIVQRVYYSEKEARDLVWVLLDVLHHLHGKKIAHRDLKPENLLLKSTHNDHDIKLADFGFATECKKPLRDLCGTPAYVAPEIIREKPYGLEVDMWSCGVIVFILLGGYPPFDDANGVSDMYAQIKRGAFTFDERYWSSVSSEAQLFIKSLLQVDPSKRPSAAAAMNHDWFTKHATELSTTDLSKTIDNMKRRNARRKLKGGHQGRHGLEPRRGGGARRAASGASIPNGTTINTQPHRANSSSGAFSMSAIGRGCSLCSSRRHTRRRPSRRG